MHKSSYYLFLLILFAGCKFEKIDIIRNDSGVITQIPFIWKSPISDGILGYGLYRGYIIDKKGVICIAMRESADPRKYGEFYVQLKDVDTGNNIWVWDEFYDKVLGSTLNRSILLHNGKMLLHDLNADYCIDTKTGKTIWKNQRDSGRLWSRPI